MSVSALIEEASGGHSIAQLFLVLAAIFGATKLLGELALRLKQPAVFGEIIAGVLLGGSVLGVLNPQDPMIHTMSEIGVVVLLFATGLHTDVGSLVRVGGPALTVALAGVVLPFAGGYFTGILLGATTTQALVCGAALCATSVGISARVLSDLGRLDTKEGRVVLGAAVIDDIVGLIILAVIAAIVAGSSVTFGSVTRISGVAIGFVLLAIVVGGRVATIGHRFVKRAHTSGALGLLAVGFAFVMAALADMMGSALIIGAFAAGLVLDDRHDRHEIEKATATIGHFFIPIFFAAVGAMVDLKALANPTSLMIGLALTVTGIIGKVAAGYAPFWLTGDKLLIGVAMVPRGEVGLIFARMGSDSGALNAGLFGAIMMMVLATTLFTPPALAYVARRRPDQTPDEPGTDMILRPPSIAGSGDGGMDDIVVGVRHDRAPPGQ